MRLSADQVRAAGFTAEHRSGADPADTWWVSGHASLLAASDGSAEVYAFTDDARTDCAWMADFTERTPTAVILATAIGAKS